jgi:hypothetical protein
MELRLMGVPISEFDYTPATAGMGDHEVRKGHVVALEKNTSKDFRWIPWFTIYSHFLSSFYRKCNLFLIFNHCNSHVSLSLQVALPFCMSEIPVSSFDPKTAYRAEIVRVFPLLLQANARMVYRIGLRLPFTLLLIHIH